MPPHRPGRFSEAIKSLVDQMHKRARHIQQGFACTYPTALGVRHFDLEVDTTFTANGSQPIDREFRRRDNGPTHENGIGDRHITELFDRPFRAVEIDIGPTADLVGIYRHASLASAATRRRPQEANTAAGMPLAGKPFRKPLSESATRNANSSA